MSKKLLTLADLENFYSNRKRSFHFCADKDTEAIAVQIPSSLTFNEDDYDPTTGLLPVHLQSSHIELNRNKSFISEEVMEECKKSIFNRPILGYIHKLSDDTYDFAGHEMYVNEEGELEYEEIACGVIPESCNPELVYDENKDKTYLEVDGYIYEEYTRAAEILKSKKESKCSVEICLLDFNFNAKSKHLEINKFYFSGVTILGVTRDTETPIQEGMYGSNIKLKDFSKSNNSMFSDMTESEHSKLIETLEQLNKTLNNISNFNIDNDNKQNQNYNEEGGKSLEDKNVNMNENEEEVIETDACKKKKNNEEDEVEVTETEACKKKKNEVEETDDSTEAFDDGGDSTDSTDNSTDDTTTDDATVENDEATEQTEETDTDKGDNDESEPEVLNEDEDDPDEPEDKDDDDDDSDDEDDSKRKPFSKTFELSHEDIRGALYTLLKPYEESDNEWYWIVEVFDDHFVYQGLMGNYWEPNYETEGDSVAFDGERYELFLEFLTASQKAELDNMKSNYSSIKEQLEKYQQSEINARREEVFNDNAYSEFIETESFKEIKENINTYSVDELRTACDLAFAKEVKNKGTFALKTEKKEEKPKANFFAFSRQERENSFLDGLLKK